MESLPGQSKETLEKNPKQARWKELALRADRITDKLGLPIDTGIKESIVVLHALDFYTSGSCEGQEDHATGAPYIDIESKEVETIDKQLGELKMKLVHAGLMFTLAFTLLSCGSDKSKSVDKDGNCTQEFVDDYKALLRSAVATGNSSNRDDLKKRGERLVQECKDFKDKHNDVQCKLLVNGRQANADTNKLNCDKIKETLDGLNSESVTSSEAGSLLDSLFE